MSEMPLKLYAKIAKIQGERIEVPKNGWNDRQQYAYAREADVINTMATVLKKNNLVLDIKELDATNVGEFVTRATYQFTLIDMDSGEFDITNMSGDGYDKTDKGIYKACTGATKYFLLRKFMIATEDDPEKDDSPKEEAPVEEPKKRPRRTSSRRASSFKSRNK